MNWQTGQGAAIMANSDNGIMVASELLRSVAREYAWKYTEKRRPFEELTLAAKLAGTDAVLEDYDALRNAQQKPPEFVLNALGYDALRAGKTEDAIRLFARNVREFPQSSNVYDSLGEAYMAKNDTRNAAENYGKALTLVKDEPNKKRIEQTLSRLKNK